MPVLYETASDRPGWAGFFVFVDIAQYAFVQEGAAILESDRLIRQREDIGGSIDVPHTRRPMDCQRHIPLKVR
ncbi:hypothetical protein [Nonomuraea helvata]|uniref:Uncharacterized protein n=1 Tax=Nonomuraea helvata TaxID=37484 RepID=A0ABV5S3C8_9ACTN